MTYNLVIIVFYVIYCTVCSSKISPTYDVKILTKEHDSMSCTTIPNIKIYRTLLDVRGGLNENLSEVSFGKWVIRLFSKIRSYFFPTPPSKPSITKKQNKTKSKSQTHLDKTFKTGDANARIQKELRAFISNPPDNCKVSIGSNIRVWIVTLKGADGTIYEGEKYRLKFSFSKEYPSKPPSVYFLKPVPKHQHVYTNGDICLNLLGRDWRPTMTAESIAVSILSMLSNAKEKKMPIDNAMHADAAPGQQQDNWMYHDDKC
mmetsp:Transcript_2811/g.2971  ORF Transcript_2811/g.2971 Transcript_2811/m.2971 type:complete len:260 (+) Transcript_2811:39-818(+)